MRLFRVTSLVTGFSLFFGFALSCTGNSFSADQVLRAGEVLKAPQNYLHRTIELEVVEPLYGPPTPQALATVEYGQVEIMIPDAMGSRLTLVPASFRLEDPNRYKHKFDRVIQAPVRVKGELLSDEDLAQQSHRPSYVLRVASIEPLVLPPPVKIQSLAQIKSDPARWDRKQITYEGVYENRFEVSALDREIWLSFQGNTDFVGRPSEASGGKKTDRVRVTGILFSKPGSTYGHLGGYPFELLASKVEYLGPAATP